MNILSIEDEINAYEYLKRMLYKIKPDIKSISNIDSVQGSLNYLSKHQDSLDLIFMDIQLADGLSFEIFNHVELNKPIIFTTAYDQYALDAFKVYSVDYLLKPIHIDDLRNAINRYEQLYATEANEANKLTEMIQSINKPKKNRCLVKRGGHYEYVDVKEIAFVNSEDSITFLHTMDGQRHIYGKTIERLFTELDLAMFFQINRSQIVNINAIHQVHPYMNQRLKVLLNPKLKASAEFVVSRNKMTSFKGWMDQ